METSLNIARIANATPCPDDNSLNQLLSRGRRIGLWSTGQSVCGWHWLLPAINGANNKQGDSLKNCVSTGGEILFKWLDFKITNRCNNNCTYCAVDHDHPESPEILSLSQIRSTTKDAIDLGFTHFAFLGGEPSVREDVERIFEPFSKHPLGCDVMVVTNGLLFRESLYRSLFDTKARRARIVFSMDSLRSPNFKNQDPLTSIQRILKIKAIAREYSGPDRERDISVHCVISRENLLDFGSLVKMFSGYGVDVSLALVCPSNFLARGNPNSFNVFTYDELGAILGQLRDLEKEGNLNFANQTLMEYLQLYPFGRLQMNTSCNAGREHVIINPDGGVFPCITESYDNGTCIGNIRDGSFREAYRRMEDFSCNRDFSPSCWDHYLWNRLGKLFEEG